jgi:signal peptidase II
MLADAEWGRVFLIVVTGLALAALAVYFFWKKPSSWLERWVFILIFSAVWAI